MSTGPPSGPAPGATGSTVRRITGATGAAFVVSLALSLLVGGVGPGTDATGAAVELYAINHYHAEQASLMLGALAAFFFLIFAGHLYGRLRRADGVTGESWAPTFLLGAVGTAALELAAEAVQAAYQELSHSGALPAQVLELFRIDNGLLAASGITLAVALVSAGISGLLNGSIPVPLAWLALVASLVALVSVGGLGTARTTFGAVSDASAALLLAWVLGVSGWLLLAGDRSAPVLAPGAPATPAEAA